MQDGCRLGFEINSWKVFCRFLKKNHLRVVWYWHCLCLKSAFDHRRGMLSPNTAENRSSFTKGSGQIYHSWTSNWVPERKLESNFQGTRTTETRFAAYGEGFRYVALWCPTTDWDKFQGRQNACGTYRQYVSLGIDYCPNLRANLGNQDRFIIRQLLGLVKVVAWRRRQIWGLGRLR